MDIIRWEVISVKFNDEKKKAIILYILEKISQKAGDISKHVAETFDVNRNTVHTYINQLVEDKIIRRVKRGQYELVSNTYNYLLERKNGDLDSDTRAYQACLQGYIKELPKNVQMIWEYTFSEMINNVMDHSEAEEVAIIITQDYLNTQVIIADNGVGIFEKIMRYFNLDSLDDAICELFKGKLTTDSENHSGEGIFFSSKIMDNFLIISSQKVFTINKYDESMIMNLLDMGLGGTTVAMSLSNYTHKQTFEIFDIYANVDGGFTKTIIPLKNIFDSSPVSRSQARRVCNRLDKFNEVILDFDELEWMGQGFAHQIFVVFAKENPEIKIEPVNMNENISKMYDHVMN